MRNTNRRGRGSYKSLDQSKEDKKSSEDYIFHVESHKQAADFETINEFVINYIKKTYTYENDISKLLISLTITNTKKWNPRLWVSPAADTEIKARETKEFKFILKAELDELIRRKRELQNNMLKAYTIWERSDKALKVLTAARIDFETKICSNPIELFEAIKEYAVNY